MCDQNRINRNEAKLPSLVSNENNSGTVNDTTTIKISNALVFLWGHKIESERLLIHQKSSCQFSRHKTIFGSIHIIFRACILFVFEMNAPYHHVQSDSFHVYTYLVSSEWMVSLSLSLRNKYKFCNEKEIGVFILLCTHKSSFKPNVIKSLKCHHVKAPGSIFGFRMLFNALKSSESSWFFTLLICVTYRIFCHLPLNTITYILFGLLFFSLVFFFSASKFVHFVYWWTISNEFDVRHTKIFIYFPSSPSLLIFPRHIHICVWFVFHNLSGLLNFIVFCTHFIFSTFGDSKKWKTKIIVPHDNNICLVDSPSVPSQHLVELGQWCLSVSYPKRQKKIGWACRQPPSMRSQFKSNIFIAQPNRLDLGCGAYRLPIKKIISLLSLSSLDPATATNLISVWQLSDVNDGARWKYSIIYYRTETEEKWMCRWQNVHHLNNTSLKFLSIPRWRMPHKRIIIRLIFIVLSFVFWNQSILVKSATYPNTHTHTHSLLLFSHW